MAHRYQSISELDEEINGGKRSLEMSIERYMKPRAFRKLGLGGGEEVIEETTIGYVCNEGEACLSKRGKELPEIKMLPYEESDDYVDGDGNIVVMEEYKKERCVRQYTKGLANSSNRVRVKNVDTGVLFEFPTMSNSARFIGATRKNMTFGILDKEARVFCAGQAKFVFEYDGVERYSGYGFEEKVLDGFVEVVWDSGFRERFDSYLSAAIHLGLLIGHVKEEEDRWRDKKLAKKYTIGRKCCMLEFNGERRQMDCRNGIVPHWKGIYVGDWKKLNVWITQGNPQPI